MIIDIKNTDVESALARLNELKKERVEIDKESRNIKNWLISFLEIPDNGKSFGFTAGKFAFSAKIPKNEKVDYPLLKLLAKENGIDFEPYFTVKAERNKSAWKSIDLEVAEILGEAVSATNGTPEITITRS